MIWPGSLNFRMIRRIFLLDFGVFLEVEDENQWTKWSVLLASLIIKSILYPLGIWQSIGQGMACVGSSELMRTTSQQPWISCIVLENPPGTRLNAKIPWTRGILKIYIRLSVSLLSMLSGLFAIHFRLLTLTIIVSLLIINTLLSNSNWIPVRLVPNSLELQRITCRVNKLSYKQAIVH